MILEPLPPEIGLPATSPRAFSGVPDATLQRSEYLGGDVTPIFFNEVESNAGTDANALGDVAGKPISAGRGSNINFKADEFGVYLCLAHVVPKRSYSDAIDLKVWKFDEPTDLPMKHFENLGDKFTRIDCLIS